MLKEIYTPRKGYLLVELVVFRPKEEKTVFINSAASKNLVKDDDVTTYRVLGAASDSDLKIGDYVQLMNDLENYSEFGTVIPEELAISKIEYEGLDDYSILTVSDLVKERDEG